MAYSTIKRKLCKGDCGRYPFLGLAGYCRYCCPDDIKKRMVDKVYNRKLSSLKHKVEKLEKVSDNFQGCSLETWFKYHMKHSPMVCENCGQSLKHYNEKEWHGSQDHIIEKSKKNGCPSVAAVLENHCVLGFFCCHSQKHTSHLNLSKMKIFPVLKGRFKKFEHLIAQDERRKIPDIFLKENE